MSESFVRYWLLLYPDVSHPIGGAKQIHRLAEAIERLGRRATVVQGSSEFHPGWFQSSVRTISKEDWFHLRDQGLDPKRDVVIAPETFLPAIETIAQGLPVVIFNQNGSYSFGLGGASPVYRPERILRAYASSTIRQVLCVSQYDHDLLTAGFQLGESNVSLITNAIEIDQCRPDRPKQREIAFMARKNSLDVHAVTGLLTSQPWFKGWSLAPIQNRPHDEVLAILKGSIAFLSFGHPEGFGLPVAEAMACGCAVIGYSGLGGRELFSLAGEAQTAVEIPVGDWAGFLRKVRLLVEAFERDQEGLAQRLLRTSRTIRDRYSPASMDQSVSEALERIEITL